MAAILIVEDDAVMARQMSETVRRAGHTPIRAPDRLAFHVYRRVCADRRKGGDPNPVEVLTWAQIAKWAKLEGLLDEEEARWVGQVPHALQEAKERALSPARSGAPSFLHVTRKLVVAGFIWRERPRRPTGNRRVFPKAVSRPAIPVLRPPALSPGTGDAASARQGVGHEGQDPGTDRKRQRGEARARQPHGGARISARFLLRTRAVLGASGDGPL